MVFPIVGGDGKPTGYEVENSLRFNTADDAFMQRTFTAGTRTKFTISCWVKRGNLSGNPNNDPHRIIDAFKDQNNVSNFFFETDDTLRFFHKSAGTTYANVVTNRLFRDPSAWYHLVCAVDTTQSTESNRIKFYVNGVQETSFSTYSVLENLATFFNDNTRICTVGAKDSSSTEKDHFDGYMADFYYIDNQQYDQTYFGKTNNNGVWIPVEKGKGAGGDLTFGTNGFFLEFQQTGTSANSSGMGADTSGNDLHLTPNNLAAIDVTTDTPTNNFCTLSSVDNDGFVLSNGNLDFDSSSGSDEGVRSTIGVLAGKWYYECKITGGSGVGLSAGNVGYSQSTMKLVNNPRGGQCIVMNGSSSINFYNFSSSAVVLDASSGVGQNDIVGVALDLDSGTKTIQFYKNGSTIGSAQTIASGLLQGDFFIPSMFDDGGVNDVIGSFNFGQPTFSISSGNADANGYGNFEYAPPSGYYSLCTKNLAEFG